ncbi:tetratricopeptide repeat protein [Thermodesulfobacteriota bacterium]
METADTLFSDILDSGPSPGTLFILLSRMKEEGQLSRVIQECRKALELYSDETSIRRLLAEALLESGQVDQAESEVEKVITRLNDLISAYSLQAEILIHQGREEEAAEALKLYLAHRPNDGEALVLMESLQSEKEVPPEPESATEEETSPPIRETGLPDIATPTLAEVYFDQGRMKEALETYEKVIAERPDDIHSRQRLDELKAMMVQDQVPEDKGKDRVRQKKERMIAILESWLAGIREQSKMGAPLN